MRHYPRKFDWDEAKRRYETGETISQIARDLGVQRNAVNRVVKPGERERQRLVQQEWNKRGICDQCGGSMSNVARHSVGATKCGDCRTKNNTKTVRPSTLRCSSCGEWRPDEEFPIGHPTATSNPRRGRQYYCKPCLNTQKRLWREMLRAPSAPPATTQTTTDKAT